MDNASKETSDKKKYGKAFDKKSSWKWHTGEMDKEPFQEYIRIKEPQFLMESGNVLESGGLVHSVLA